jgi:D-glycero-D-manno-heptose 1,7-bisphosphate phosphatase
LSSRRAAFVDRDGTLNELVPDPSSGFPESPLHPDAVVLCPGAAGALRELAARGWLLIGVTNQPAAAKGKISPRRLAEVQARVLDLLAAEGVVFHDFRVCPHHPDAVIAELSGPCDCRKPLPGMILAAARERDVDLSRSWMIGDTDSDVLAGRRAGCRTALILHEASAHKRGPRITADLVAPDLASIVGLLPRPEDVH